VTTGVSALSVRDASKVFGGQVALDHVSIEVAPGEIRALVGQNGCGKSTLIKILAGYHVPEPGISVEVDGLALGSGDPNASAEVGLRFVHQDLGLVADLDVVDNIALGKGYLTGVTQTIKWRQERKDARDALAALGYDIDVRTLVGRLRMSERTAVAIARAMSDTRSAPKVLILDEPTANLPVAEAMRLYALVRRVASSGVAVLFVSHHFDEVFEMADSVTVLRDGKLVLTRSVEGLTEDALIALVIGRQLEEFERHGGTRVHGEPVLVVENLSGASLLEANFTLHAGEVVGIAGLTGSGREEIAPMVFGGHGHRGRISVGGEELPEQRPDISMEHGLALVPAERHANAAFMMQSLRENVTIVDPERHWKLGFLRGRQERTDVTGWLERMDVRPPKPEFTMSQLSGGNQQKVVITRWLRQEPRVLILDEPTQGVDVGSKADIHRLVDEAAAQGAAVLVVSTDHEELVRVCDRVLIMRRGRVAEEISGAQLNNDRITAATIGRDSEGAPQLPVADPTAQWPLPDPPSTPGDSRV
jgi:ribose transport system ATP-binding protein